MFKDDTRPLKYRDRLPESERTGPLPHSGNIKVGSDTIVYKVDAKAEALRRHNHNQYLRGLNKMFNVENNAPPVVARGRKANDTKATELYKSLIAFPLQQWRSLTLPNKEKAQQMATRINVCAKDGAGTFRTRSEPLEGGQVKLWVIRTNEVYEKQRNTATDVTEQYLEAQGQ